MGESAGHGHRSDRVGAGAQQPARSLQTQREQELVRRLSRARPELPGELAAAQ
jgi:hypothetical protein